jgi:hypothetical protein
MRRESPYTAGEVPAVAPITRGAVEPALDSDPVFLLHVPSCVVQGVGQRGLAKVLDRACAGWPAFLRAVAMAFRSRVKAFGGTR